MATTTTPPPPTGDLSGSFTAYNPPPGTDPEWDAYVAGYTAKVANANADAARGRAMLQNTYDAGLATLQQQLPLQEQSVEAGLLARGIGRSGEAARRRATVQQNYLSQLNEADRNRVEGMSNLDATLASNITNLAADREAQIAQSRLRIAAAHGQVPGVTTPGYTPPVLPPKTAAPKQPKATPRPVLPTQPPPGSTLPPQPTLPTKPPPLGTPRPSYPKVPRY